jgi:hypothetical protein
MNWIKELLVVHCPHKETNDSNKLPKLVSKFI